MRICKGSQKGTGDQIMQQQQLQQKQLHVLGLFFLGRRWLSRDTVHWQAGKRWKETDWSFSLAIQELGSSVMVLGARLKQKEAIYHMVVTSAVEHFAKGWHRWESLCESHWDSASIWKRSNQTNHIRFRKHPQLKPGRYQESIRASHTLTLFFPFQWL